MINGGNHKIVLRKSFLNNFNKLELCTESTHQHICMCLKVLRVLRYVLKWQEQWHGDLPQLTVLKNFSEFTENYSATLLKTELR